MMTNRSLLGCIVAALSACDAPADEEITCGEGTMLEGDECVAPEPPPPFTCTAGSLDPTGSCVIDIARYEVRIAETTLGANGHTKRKVLVTGIKADGTVSDEEVIIRPSRASAGTLTREHLTLGPHGATTYFTPCAESAPGCLGPATLSLALASSPDVEVASVPIELVAPTTVSTIAPCTNARDVLYVDSNDYVWNGMITLTEAVWFYEHDYPTQVAFNLTPTGIGQGGNWSLRFDSTLIGPLEVRTYDQVRDYHTSVPGFAGISLFGPRGCSTQSGAFQIHELNAGAVLVSFEIHCTSDTTRIAEGCARYGFAP